MTLEMADLLAAQGYESRVVYRVAEVSLRARLRSSFRMFETSMWGSERHSWLGQYNGKLEPFRTLEELAYEPGEVVIAVGSMTIRDVLALKKDVRKVRYCHGFSCSISAEDERALWGGEMTTIAVAKSLVPRLEELSEKPVAAVVSNGIRKSEYFDEAIDRRGVCLQFSPHPNKAPEVTKALYERFCREAPELPLRVFGAAPRPKWISRKHYYRLPSVEQVRSIFSASDVFILASIEEGFGLPVLEAMACGCAVVSTENLGSMELIVHGSNGVLVPIGSVHDLFNRTAELMSDTVTRTRLVAESQKTVSHFTWDRSVRQMKEFLNRYT